VNPGIPGVAYTVVFWSEVIVEGDIRHVPKSKLRAAIEQVEQTPEVGKHLTGDLQGYRSTRIGGSVGRIIYRILEGEQRVEVVAMGQRKDDAVCDTAAGRV